jgi:predicted enzyme related to lactoylglutathione lyase
MTIRSDKPEIRPNWLLFVRVKSIADSTALAEQLGGKILLTPQPDLFNGKLAVVADPSGAAVGLMEWSTPASTEGQ